MGSLLSGERVRERFRVGEKKRDFCILEDRSHLFPPSSHLTINPFSTPCPFPSSHTFSHPNPSSKNLQPYFHPKSHLLLSSRITPLREFLSANGGGRMDMKCQLQPNPRNCVFRACSEQDFCEFLLPLSGMRGGG